MNTMQAIELAFQKFERLPVEQKHELVRKHRPVFAAGFKMGMRYGSKKKYENSMANLKLPKSKPRVKQELLQCQCGCESWWMASWKTRKPIYKNRAHQQRAYRDRVAAKAAAADQSLD